MVLSAPDGVEVNAADVKFLLDSETFTASDVATKELLAKTEGRLKGDIKINADGLAATDAQIEKVRSQPAQRMSPHEKKPHLSYRGYFFIYNVPIYSNRPRFQERVQSGIAGL